MDDVFGYGDHSNSGWEGLACPPLEDLAFSFVDDTCFNLDGILDHPSLEAEKDSRAANGIDKKTKICYGNNGKGKQLKLNLNMAEIKAFLQQDTKQVAEQKVKTRRIMDCYDCQSLQQKERPGLNHTNVVVDRKRKADFDVRLEAAGHKLHGDGSHESSQPMQPKYRVRLVHKNQHGAVNTKRKPDIGCRLEASRSSESACQPMRREDLMRLDYTNQIAVADNKMQTDYESRYEATRRKLHVSYEQEAKQQRKIQVIDFQKAVMEQPRRCRTKGTHNSKKKFQPFVY